MLAMTDLHTGNSLWLITANQMSFFQVELPQIQNFDIWTRVEDCSSDYLNAHRITLHIEGAGL